LTAKILPRWVKAFRASGDRWIGAKVDLIASADPSATSFGYADYDWFHVTPLMP
jgi:hypothetical protein